MDNMIEMIKTLFELQTLEFEETVQPDSEKRAAALRAQIPQPILAHYDRLCASGKKGVALLQHQTCGACHMSVPLGVVLELKRRDDVRCCENCGRYLYLRDEPAPAPVPVPNLVAPVKTVRHSGRKALAHAR
jgi:predicted  nucleic acid-binding Zn-ribbon protein